MDSGKTGKLSTILLAGLVLIGVGVSQASGDPAVSMGDNGVQINSGSLGLGGGDITDGGTTVWDSSTGQIPTSVIDYTAATASDVGLSNVENIALSSATWSDIGISQSDVSASDVGLGNVENEAQVAASGDTMTGDLTIGSSNDLYVRTVRGEGSNYVDFQDTIDMNSNSITDVADLRLSSQGDSIYQNGMPENRLVLDIDQNSYQDYGLGSSAGVYLSSRSATQDIHLIGDINNGNNKCTLDADTGDWSCDGTKSWIHDLGNGSEAVYTSQESPQVRAVYEGKTNVDGETRVELPEHFSGTVSDTEPKLRATATVQGELAYAAVIEKTDDYIVLDSSNPATVNYRVTGIREGYEDKQVVRPKEE